MNFSKLHSFYGNFTVLDVSEQSDSKTHFENTKKNGERWDVRLDYVRQFKTDYVRRLEGLVFEGKKVYG
jgi:hypothetical protein